MIAGQRLPDRRVCAASRSHSSPSACTSSSKRMPQTELHSPDMLPSISAAPLSGPCSLRPVCRDVDDFRLAPRSPFADVQHLPGTPGLTFSAVDSPHMASPWLSPPIAWAPPRSACQQRQQQQPQPRSHCYANEQLGTPGGRCQHSLQTSGKPSILSGVAPCRPLDSVAISMSRGCCFTEADRCAESSAFIVPDATCQVA